MMRLNKNEQKQIDMGIEITFMHIKDILKHPEKLDKIPDGAQFFPVYLKEKNKTAALVGVKPTAIPA